MLLAQQPALDLRSLFVANILGPPSFGVCNVNLSPNISNFKGGFERTGFARDLHRSQLCAFEQAFQDRSAGFQFKGPGRAIL